MLIRFFTIIVTVSFCATAFAQDTALETEAARFAKEARFLYDQGRFEDALDRAEVAFALDPDSNEAKLSLCTILFAVAEPKDNPADNTKPIVEQAREKLQYASRALDLIETGFLEDEAYQRFSYSPIRQLIAWLDDCSAKYPALQPSVKAFQLRFVKLWMSAPNHISSRNTNDPMKVFESAVFNLRSCNTVFGRARSSATPVINIDSYEFVIPHLFQLFHDIPDEKLDEMEGYPRPWLISSSNEDCFNGIIANFIIDAVAIRNAKPEDRDVLRRYDHLISMMERDSSPMIRNFGWMARNNPGQQGMGWEPYTPERAAWYYEKLKQRIEEHPPVRQVFEIGMLYDKMRLMAIRRIGSRMSLLESLDEIVRASPYEAEILELAIRRKEMINDNYFIYRLDKISSFLSTDEQERYEKVVADYLTMVETVDREAYTRLQEVMRRYNTGPSQPPVPPSKPWIEEIPLVSTSSESVIFHPFFRGNTLYYFTASFGDGKTRLNSIDLETRQIKQGKEFQALPNRISSDEGVTYVYSLPCHDDDQNCYITLVHSKSRGHDDVGEICVFPLNGDDPWTFGTETDLPSGQIRQVCSFNGKLYVVVEEASMFFVAIDLKTKMAEILSSTSARDGKAPFFNISPAPKFCCFFVDKPRNRLLFFLVSGLPEWGGLWSMDGKTGTYTHHLSQTSTDTKYYQPDQVQIFDDPNRLLISSSFGYFNMIIDLISLSEWKDTVFGQSQNMQRFLINRGVVAVQAVYCQNALWGNFGVYATFPNSHWLRLPYTENAKLERLEPLSNFKLPKYFVPLPNDKGLVVGNGRHLVLLRFE